jgi:hypothetical protein
VGASSGATSGGSRWLRLPADRGEPLARLGDLGKTRVGLLPVLEEARVPGAGASGIAQAIARPRETVLIEKPCGRVEPLLGRVAQEKLVFGGRLAPQAQRIVRPGQDLVTGAQVRVARQRLKDLPGLPRPAAEQGQRAAREVDLLAREARVPGAGGKMG